MERENGQGIIPPLFAEPNPIELSPEAPAYKYYVERRTMSCLEDLSHTTDNNDLTEKINYLATEFLLLRLHTRGSKMTPGDQMSCDVFDNVLNLFKDNEAVTCEAVSQKYREYIKDHTDSLALVREFVENPTITEQPVV